MNRKQITVNNFIKELQKTGTLNYIYRGTFTDDLQQSTWYEKVSRSPYIYIEKMILKNGLHIK